jgi:hypothetical protein
MGAPKIQNHFFDCFFKNKARLGYKTVVSKAMWCLAAIFYF